MVVEPVFSPSSLSLSLMSWNILAQQFAKKQHWKLANPRFLKASYRRPLLLKRIETSAPDILCLQECDDFTGFWKKQLASRGYETVYQQRNGKKPDGCCIAFSRRFECVEKQALFYDDLKVLGTIDPSRKVEEIKEKNEVFEADAVLQARAALWQEEQVEKSNTSRDLTSFETNNIGLMVVLEEKRSECGRRM